MDAGTMLQALASLDDVTLARVITETLSKRPELAPGVVNSAVPDLTYAPAASLSERRATGKVKPIGSTGFGFIDCPELKAVFGSDVYVHKNQVGSLPPGTEVNFAILLSKDMKPQAFDLQAIGGPPPMGGKGGMDKGGYGGGPGFGMGAMGGSMSGVQSVFSQGGMMGKGNGMMGGGMMGGMMGGGMMGGKGDWGKGFEGKGSKVLSAEARPDVQQTLGNFVGMIKSFNAKNGFGFIVCEALQQQGYSQDVYLHHNQIGDFQPGQTVFFECYLNKKGQPQSMNLQAMG